MGYKAGMSHILREVEKPGSKIHKKEATEVSLIISGPLDSETFSYNGIKVMTMVATFVATSSILQ